MARPRSDLNIDPSSLAWISAPRAQARAEQAARIRQARAAWEAKTLAAHAAAMATEYRPSLTPGQIRDALARARRLKALRTSHHAD